MPCLIDRRAIEAAAHHRTQCGIGWAGTSRKERVFAEDTRRASRAGFSCLSSLTNYPVNSFSTSQINILARVVKAIVSLASSKLTPCFSHGIIRKKLHNICLYKNEEHLFVHLFCSLYTPSACDGEITGGVKNGKPRSRLQPDWGFFLSSGSFQSHALLVS